MPVVSFSIADEASMIELGATLGALLEARGGVLINGDLGAGKTTLCRGLVQSLGHRGAVKSPTFTLVEPYEISGIEIYHFDLYRLSHPDELDYIGIDEYFHDNALCLVEWPEKAAGCLPPHDLEISIDVLGETRNISVQANSARGELICDSLAQQYCQT